MACNMMCKAVNLAIMLPTILFALACMYMLYQARQQVQTVTEALGSKEIVLPSFDDLAGFVHGPPDEVLSTRFSSWATAYNKKYASESEKRKRLALFAASTKLVEEHNAKIPADSDKYRLGLNEFADLSDAEFFEMYGLGKLKGQEDCSATRKNLQGSPNVQTEIPADLPQAIDWRDKGIVSPVKNQGHCGSCWTFSSTGALEAYYKKKHGRFVSLSEQQLLDCAGNYDNHGCNGGLPSHAFQYIMENGGLDTERAYPYEMTSENTKCRFRKWGVGIRVTKVHNITQFDEKELEVAVGTAGPVSVAFQVASDFRLYAGGVYDSAVCKNQPKDVNHAVLAVGYGVSPEGTKYWIVKNSWGEGWGVKGYFLIKRGVNMCGISDCASYPEVA